jgi:hypothetical protein
MQKDLKDLERASNELRELISEFRRFLNFQCNIFPLGCYECNTNECYNHVVIRIIAWEIGRIFSDTGIRMAEEILLLLLESRNKALKLNALYALEKVRISGFLTATTLLKLDKFKQNVINWEICEKVDYALMVEKARFN